MRKDTSDPNDASNHPQRSGHVNAARWTVVLGVVGLLALLVPLFRGQLDAAMATVFLPASAILVIGGVLGVFALRERDRRRFGRLSVAACLVSVSALVVGVLLKWLLL